MASIEQLAATLQEVAGPGVKRKNFFAAVRKLHPKASKKDIVRAAFYALMSVADRDVECARRLQDFALSERTAEEAEPLMPVKRRKKDRRKDAQRGQQATH